MSLLWPDRVHVGLFSGHCWLQQGKASTEAPIACPQPDDYLLALDALLDKPTKALRPGSRVALTVSDSLAASIALPWQAELTEAGELATYARICFEQAGIEVGADWVLATYFRHYGAQGLAYALPAGWLEQLGASLQRRGLRLQGVLPASAAAYSLHACPAKQTLSLLLLREPTRITALVYVLGKLQARDVEPVTRSEQEAGTRLLRRLSVQHGNFARVDTWSPLGPEADIPARYIAASWPTAEVRTFARMAWC
ncbi:hypothetical protein GCM10007907_24600 [Chitinimonas prasina]|uniref:Uncharacterized protein n=1 Tax=Chitinimonas prasina TaxID=1434937 RepID=A0ABQ5YF96_9NEIS|nr:hypothetical protein [Chitinimonas prasina]GLR13670.1 hypothetical protein GCM10007907_24600 [Chitinimonas prasina]